ncbi:hypothetical protein M0813_29977 [Anaeramoeba flamelloides]|uniref:Uncharacterized protein n=1 Tax=Anaeramoeba flamelloides TaxID=1746091 RepID=A0ABQ8XQL2_9EUKA|nr:hypothetical protein M0813_29977 [Anaeramoeba flamelloides]
MSRQERKEFKINEISETEIRVDVVSTDYDNFGEWFTYVDHNGKWLQSLPMKTSFKAPLNKKEEVKAAMIQHGYSEIN